MCTLTREFVSLQRILVATNLFGRGMDIERVNIVFNYDMPEDSDTYLHRVARAGRFGTKVCIHTVFSPVHVLPFLVCIFVLLTLPHPLIRMLTIS